jgi:branched-chain amino acid aminotransferase
MTHAFNYGTGVFEGIKGYFNAEKNQVFVFRLREHLERLIKNCRIIKMYIEQPPEELERIILELVRRNDFRTDIYIRPLAYKSSEKVGVRLLDDYDICVFAVPVGAYFDPKKPLSTCISSWRRTDDNTIPGRGKITGAYVNSALAAQEARDNGFDEAIFLNQNGHVSEGAAMNLFMVKNGVLYTPPVTDNILEGITRHMVMDIAREELGIDTVERSIDRTELYLADELFFCGTIAEVTPVGAVDHRLIEDGRMGKITGKIRALFHQIVRGEMETYHRWLSPVYEHADHTVRADENAGLAREIRG